MRLVRYYPRALAGDGGMTGAVCASAREMVRQGIDVTVLYEPGSPAHEPSPSDGVRWIAVPHRGRGPLRIPTGLEDYLRNSDLVVLHSGWTSNNLAAAAAARRAGVPYLLEPRGAYDPHIVRRHRPAKRVWWFGGERRMVGRSLAVHVFFSSERDHLARLGYEGPIVISPNGVAAPNGAMWDGGSGGYLLWLGRFDPEHKGLDLLLDAVSLMSASSRPILRLHGPDWRGRKNAVLHMVEAKGLQKSVEIGGPVYGDEKTELLSKAKAFVYPSRWEAFGNSVAEAASMGIPVVTTSFPLGTFLGERDAGVACSANPVDLADGISEVLGPGAARYGTRARIVAEQDLGWAVATRSWLSQVESLL